MKLRDLFLTFLLFTPVVAFSQSPEAIDFEAIRKTKVMTAVRISEPITIDGKLDEAAWQKAIPVRDFTQRVPRLGAPPSDPTEVRILYDDKNLYIGATAFDSEIGRAHV